MTTVVTPRSAQGIPAVYSAVTIISEAIAALPIALHSNGKEITSSPVKTLLSSRPNSWMTPFEFMECVTRSALLTGNGYAWIHDGWLEPLHPNQVTIELLQPPVEGRLYRYLVSDRLGKLHTLQPEELLHLRGPSDDGISGISPISLCRETLGLGQNQIMHGCRLFENGARPGGVLSTEQVLKDDSFSRIQGSWNETYAGADNAHKTAILEAGLKYQAIGMNNEDSQWLASRQFTTLDIARMFKVPPVYLADLSGDQYANVSESRRALVNQCLLPWLTRWQQCIERDLLPDTGITAQFDTRAYLKGNTAERYAAYEVAIKAGFLTVDEVRAEEHLPPLAQPQQESAANDAANAV